MEPFKIMCLGSETESNMFYYLDPIKLNFEQYGQYFGHVYRLDISANIHSKRYDCFLHHIVLKEPQTSVSGDISAISADI